MMGGKVSAKHLSKCHACPAHHEQSAGDRASLQWLVKLLPPFVMRRNQEILVAIKALTVFYSPSGEQQLQASAPTVSCACKMLSPILGSEVLYYQQAEWIFELGNDKGMHNFLDANAANRGYCSTLYSLHSI